MSNIVGCSVKKKLISFCRQSSRRILPAAEAESHAPMPRIGGPSRVYHPFVSDFSAQAESINYRIQMSSNFKYVVGPGRVDHPSNLKIEIQASSNFACLSSFCLVIPGHRNPVVLEFRPRLRPTHRSPVVIRRVYHPSIEIQSSSSWTRNSGRQPRPIQASSNSGRRPGPGRVSSIEIQSSSNLGRPRPTPSSSE